MPYLGNNLGVAFSSYKLIDSLTASFNGTTTSFALTVNGVTPVPFPLNEQNILLSVGGVPQKPDSTGTEGFRFSGSNIVFSSAPKTGEAFWGVILAGADRVNAGVQYPDGTASVPSISFASQTTTGFYRSGSGQIGVGINGSTPVAFSTSGVQLNGLTSGSVIIASPAVAGNNTLTLPTSNGSANQFLKNGATAGSLGWSSLVEDSSGRVGIGTTSPSYPLQVDTTGTGTAAGDNTSIYIQSQASGRDCNIRFGDSVNSSARIGYLSNNLYFYVNGSERGRWDSSGRLLVGTSSALSGERFRVANSGAGQNTAVFTFDSSDDRAAVITLHTGSSGATSRKHFEFLDGGGFSRGSISVTGSATAYNTSSDYRLKENVVPVTDGIARFKQLKPSRFNFIGKGNPTVDGFIAHEAQAVIPECVTGEKDAVDDEGNPVYQGIDQSKLVPLLTAALQEAIAKIEALETRLTAAGIA